MTFSRIHLRDALTKRFGLKRELAADIVEEVLVQIAEQILLGNRVELRGFGIFEPKVRKPRIGRNPSKPERGDYIIPQRKTIKFRAGRTLDEVLNQPEETQPATAEPPVPDNPPQAPR